MKRFLSMFLVLVMLAGTVPAVLAVEAPEGYYGSRLTDPEAIAFYQVLETMDFKSGGNVPMENPAVIKLAEAYAGGRDDLLRRFGAAVDSFRYDHTEFFYVDWDMLSVNVGRQNGQYVVNVGTGRTDSYLRDKNADIVQQIAAYNTSLDKMVADVRANAGSSTSVKALAKAANDAVCAAVEYDFCDDANGNATTESKYIRTAYGALVNGRAVCEGYSRLYKAVLNRLGVECELVSGYYLEGEAFEPHMWNYVQDEEGRWYAVDVTMNDGHRLQMGGIETTFEKYFWQTEELFAIDHVEDGKVSSVGYEMPYPELHKFWVTPTSSGKFDSGYEAYDGNSGFWFSYDGKSANDLKKDGLYMAFRTATTNTGEVKWSPWQSVDAMNIYHEGGVVSEGGKTYILMPNNALFALEAGIFDTPEDVENKVGDTVVSVQYSEEAVMSHLIEKMTVENPTHDPDYIAPTHVRTTKPDNLLQAWMDVQSGTQHVELTYGDPLRETGGGMKLEWDVSSYNNRDLSLEAVSKYAKVENVKFDGDRTISFDFTPSRMYNHNMIFYDFTVKNMVNIIAGGEDGVALPSFSIGARYEDDIACCKIFNDGRLYVNSYAQPSIAMNGDLSMNGWTYMDDEGSERKVSEGQRSQMALVVTRPNDSKDLAEAAEGKAGAAAVQSMTYEIDLNICGKIVSIPNGSYMKLNLGIPDGFEDLVGNEDVKFKLYHFKRGADGQIDYSATEEIECVFTPYGIIAEVNSFSPYVLVAVDNSQLPVEERDTSKGIALITNGHGGKVEGSVSAASTLNKDETATYTITPDEGYEVESVRLNGNAVTLDGSQITLTYEALSSSNTLEVGFVAKSVKEAESEAGIENVSPILSPALPDNPGHTHSWATSWTTNGTHHWHECQGGGICNVTSNNGKDGYGSHVYDDETDTTCNTCGYTRILTPQTCAVKVTNGTASPAEAKQGDSVTLTAAVGSNQRFVKWSITPDVTLTAGTLESETVTFTMPAEEVTAAAEVKEGLPNPPAEDENGNEFFLEMEIGISTIPTELASKYDTPADLTKAMKTKVTQSGISAANTAVYDVSLMIKTSDADKWVPATEDNFPSEGRLTVTLPYPSGTGRTTHTFTVVHMFTQTAFGKTPGNVEYPTVTNTADGIQFTVTGLSPISVGWKTISSSGGDGVEGGGGSSDNDSSDNSDSGYENYTVSVGSDTHGEVTVSPSSAPAGRKVTLTIKPDSGYELDEVVVKDSKGNEVKLTRVSDTKYTFIMPPRKVTVEPTFVKVDQQPVQTASFNDVPARAWYTEAVNYAASNNIMSGTGDGNFSPDVTTSRSMIVQMLYAMEGKPLAKGAAFADVPSNAWYADAVTWASSNGIVSGIGDNMFAPDAPITREQLALILYGYSKDKGYDVSGAASLSRYIDADSVSSWAKDAMSWAVGSGLISGMTETTLGPGGSATRAQVAVILMNFCENITK